MVRAVWKHAEGQAVASLIATQLWTIYKDPFLTSTSWIQGYKGNSFLDTGYVYSPYIPLYTTPTIILDDFIGRKGIGTQYGKKTINSLFYVTGTLVNP
jgi:hypothetical protein